MEYRSLHGL
jgi:hypothetical protein